MAKYKLQEMWMGSHLFKCWKMKKEIIRIIFGRMYRVSCPLTFKYSINFSSACHHFGGVFFAKSQNIFENCLKFTRSAIVIRRRNDYNIFTPRLIDGFRAIKARTIKAKGIEQDECCCWRKKHRYYSRRKHSLCTSTSGNGLFKPGGKTCCGYDRGRGLQSELHTQARMQHTAAAIWRWWGAPRLWTHAAIRSYCCRSKTISGLP